MTLTVNGHTYHLVPCTACGHIAYGTRDWPRLGLKEFRCAQCQHLEFVAMPSQAPPAQQEVA